MFQPLDELRAVRDLRDVTAVAKAVLYALVLRADREAHCYPGADQIAADAGISLRCVRATVATLALKGHISIERRSVDGRTTSNLYTVHVVHPGVNDVHPGVNEVQGEGAPAAGGRVHDVQGGGCTSCTQTAHSDLPILTAHLSESAADAATPAEPTPRASRRRAETPAPPSTATADEVDAWCAQWAIPSPAENAEALAMLDHARTKDRRCRDWSAAWRTWLRRAAQFGPRRAPAKVGVQRDADWGST